MTTHANDLLIIRIELEDVSDPEVLREAHLRRCAAILREFVEAGCPTFSFGFDFDGTQHHAGIPFILEPSAEGCLLRIATSADVLDSAKAMRRPRDMRQKAEDIARARSRQEGLRAQEYEFHCHSTVVTPERLLAGLRSFLVGETMLL